VLGASTGISSGAAAADTYTMRLSLAQLATSLNGIAAYRFSDAINRRSNGQLKIEVYPNGQLAKQQETIDGLVSGIIDFGIQATSFVAPLFSRYQVFDLPFLFKSVDAVYRVLGGSIGDELFAELESKGIVGLSWGSGSFKQLDTTSKPIVVPADMKGLRIRVVGSVYAATYQALGAIPVLIDISEAFVALQQHTIDAVDSTLDEFTAKKFYTIVRHVALANIGFTDSPLMVSKRKFEALPTSLQRIIKDEAKALIPYWRSLNEKLVADASKILKDNGVAFTDPDHAAFRKAVEPVYAMVQSKVGGDLIERVSRTANAV
jgi:TRAP-type transport system periplasmic protein